MYVISEDLVEKLIEELMLGCDDYVRLVNRTILADKLEKLRRCEAAMFQGNGYYSGNDLE